MKICVWRTGHEIADTVAEAAWSGLTKDHPYTRQSIGGQIPRMFSDGNVQVSFRNINEEHIPNWDRTTKAIRSHDIHIGYGILRNIDKVWKLCEQYNKPYFIVDRGYFKPGHYDGYYRVSLRGTQQTSGWPEPVWERWEKLQLPVAEPLKRDGYALVCPPTDHVCEWLNWSDVDCDIWDRKHNPENSLIRYKSCTRPLDDDLAAASRVITFNSSVGWEALRRGIPVESDPVHSIVGAWQAKHGVGKREELFAVMSACQLTLDEMRGGLLMPLLQKLLDASAANKA